MLARVHQARRLVGRGAEPIAVELEIDQGQLGGAASECVPCCFTHRVDDQQREDQCQQPRPPPRVLQSCRVLTRRATS